MPFTSIPLSDPAANKAFFETILNRPARMAVRKGGYTVNFNGWKEQLLSLTRERIYMITTEIIPLAEALEDAGGDINSEEFDDLMGDRMCDTEVNNPFKGLLLDDDSNKALYLDYSGTVENEYHVVGDNIFIRSIKAFDTCGASYNQLFPSVDLTKFVCRDYIINDDFNASKQNHTELDVEVNFYHGEVTLSDSRVDNELLRGWMMFQFMKQLFPVKFDPYFERDGLIHLKSSGYSTLLPEFEIPKHIMYIEKTLEDLKLCNKYRDSEWF